MQAVFDRQTLAAARQNFGFAKVERSAGNIGYMDVRNFPPVAVAADTAAAAFSFLANTDALIVDVRNNSGGQPGMVAFVSSYLFTAPTHLNDLYNRLTGETRQSWTLPYVPGKRFTGKDVYVLTSPRTFSAGEEFAYTLKHLKRATVIGENTEGGAHLVTPRRITDHFTMAVPVGRPINPVTKSNWEATGVEPDVRVSSADALTIAHLRALEAQQQRLPADAIMLRNEVASAIAALKTQQRR